MSILVANLLLISNHLTAQYNCKLLKNLKYSGQSLSGLWGYSDSLYNFEYALVGTSKGMSIVDITLADSAKQVKFINGSVGSWREIRTYKNFAYIAQDNNGSATSEGLLIVNLSNLSSSSISVDSFKTDDKGNRIFSTHSLHLDEKNGLLFLNGGRGGININGTKRDGTAIYDLKPDPTKPKFLGFQNQYYVHDCFSNDTLLFENEINNGTTGIYNIKNPSNPLFITRFNTPYNFTHNSWLSNDQKTLFTTDEREYAPVTAYDISDLSDIRELSRVKFTPNEKSIPHNVHVKDDYLIVSHYKRGVVIWDASDPKNIILIGFYDTSTRFEGSNTPFNGAWGAFGYYSSGKIVVSDIEDGLFIINPTYIRAARLEGLVTDSTNGNPITGATINFVDTSISVSSGSDGLYKTGTPKAGTFTIKVEKAGYITKYVQVTLSNGSKVVANVQLLPIASSIQHNNSLDNQIHAFVSGNQLQVESQVRQTISQVELFDVMGRLQAYSRSSAPVQSLDISAIPKGIYFLRVNFDGGDFAVKKLALN